MSFRYFVTGVVVSTMLLSAQEADRGRPGRDQARSMVITKFGIVSTSQTLASQAGAQILEAGGNAIDAAIAANAVLGLVEPESDGIGGDLFALYYEAKTKKLYGLNASGWAPSGLTVEMLKSRGIKSMPRDGIYSVSVPGSVAGWEALRTRFGSMPYSKILAPAIYYSEQGFPVTEIISNDWKSSEKKIEQNIYTKKTFMPNGHTPAVGEIFKNPDLGASLRRIVASGPDGFYKGPTAEAILQLSKEMGGTFRASDLTDYKPEWVEPISIDYHGWTVTELPPNGAGVAVLEMLNIMEQFPLAKYGHNSAEALHVMIEAKKLSYSDMLRYIGDPKFSKLPVEQLISKQLGKVRATQIDANKAACAVTPVNLSTLASKSGGDTVYFTVVDKDGNMVSFIESVFSFFGSGLVAPNTGVLLHNRAALFNMEAGHPDQIEPHKRPIHTLIPGFLSKGDTRIAFGIMGGWNQPQAHAQFVSNVVDFGMNMQWALEAPRFSKGTFEGCDVSIESRVDPATRAKLTAIGHQIRDVGAFSGSMGGGQAIMTDGNGVHYAGSDPRKDGAAVPQSPPLPK